jgi:O-antigen/teichoic acid export membrane protein
LRFGDVVNAVAWLVVILALFDFLLGMVLIPAIGLDWGSYVTGAVSIFISALIVGYICARRIWEESGMETIARITVLGAVLLVFYVVNYPALGDWTPSVKEAI